MNSTGAAEGRFPQGMGEIMLSSNAARVLQVAVGDTVTLRTPSGDWDFTVSGLGGVEESYYSGQYSLMDAYLPRTAFAALMEQNNVHNLQTSYYVQFTSASKAAKAIPELTAQHNLPENAVSENTGVMAIAGQSDSSAAKNVYSLAAVLFVLVLLAGVLMISGSMNSNLAQRIQFFGMMRCIGMSKSQIIRFVRLEALNWCKTAVPVGVLLGTLASWSICAALHYGIGGEFPQHRFSNQSCRFSQWHRGRYRDRPAGGRVTGAAGGTGLTCGGGLRHGRESFRFASCFKL